MRKSNQTYVKCEGCGRPIDPDKVDYCESCLEEQHTLGMHDPENDVMFYSGWACDHPKDLTKIIFS